MNVVPAPCALLGGNFKGRFYPAGRVFFFGGPQLFRHAVAEGADVLLVQCEYVSTGRRRGDCAVVIN